MFLLLHYFPFLFSVTEFGARETIHRQAIYRTHFETHFLGSEVGGNHTPQAAFQRAQTAHCRFTNVLYCACMRMHVFCVFLCVCLSIVLV